MKEKKFKKYAAWGMMLAAAISTGPTKCCSTPQTSPHGAVGTAGMSQRVLTWVGSRTRFKEAGWQHRDKKKENFP